MSIEKLGKIGISVGIAVGVLVIFMIGAAIPDTIERYHPQPHLVTQFDQTTNEYDIDAEFLMSKFNQTEAYSVFVHRYPDHVSNLDVHEHGGYLRLIAVNTDRNNVLELRLNMNAGDNWRLEQDAECQIGASTDRGEIRARNSAVVEFIKKTDCIE